MRTDHSNTAAPADPAQQCPRYPFLTLPPGTNINPNPKARPFPAAVSQPGTDTHTHTHTPHHSGFSPSGEGLTCPACRGAAGSPFDSCTTQKQEHASLRCSSELWSGYCSLNHQDTGVAITRAAVSSEHITGNTHLQHMAVNEGGRHTAAQKETRRGKKGWEEALGSLKCKKKKKRRKKDSSSEDLKDGNISTCGSSSQMVFLQFLRPRGAI